jgi:hypothetical protein
MSFAFASAGMSAAWNQHAPNSQKALNRKIGETMNNKIFVVVLP